VYRANRKQCIRKILGEDESPHCTIPTSILEDHFRQPPPPPPTSPPPDWLPSPPEDVDPDDLTHPISGQEVKAQLGRFPSQSSPAPDGVPYHALKILNPTQLADILNVCLLNRRTPASWKASNTILVHKKGGRDHPANWRPISLQCTIYKLYSAILAKWLTAWAVDGKKVSSAQKGFLPFEGCMEHSFLMRRLSRTASGERKT
jgi:hypothetical protein